MGSNGWVSEVMQCKGVPYLGYGSLHHRALSRGFNDLLGSNFLSHEVMASVTYDYLAETLFSWLSSHGVESYQVGLRVGNLGYDGSVAFGCFHRLLILISTKLFDGSSSRFYFCRYFPYVVCSRISTLVLGSMMGPVSLLPREFVNGSPGLGVLLSDMEVQSYYEAWSRGGRCLNRRLLRSYVRGFLELYIGGGMSPLSCAVRFRIIRWMSSDFVQVTRRLCEQIFRSLGDQLPLLLGGVLLGVSRRSGEERRNCRGAVDGFGRGQPQVRGEGPLFSEPLVAGALVVFTFLCDKIRLFHGCMCGSGIIFRVTRVDRGSYWFKSY